VYKEKKERRRNRYGPFVRKRINTPCADSTEQAPPIHCSAIIFQTGSKTS